MELPVGFQLRELGWALLVGLGLGVLNDLLRPLRRGRGGTALADALWCLSLLLVLPGFTLYAGRGRLRVFALLAMGLSGGFWAAFSCQVRKKWKKGKINEKILRKKQKKYCI